MFLLEVGRWEIRWQRLGREGRREKEEESREDKVCRFGSKSFTVPFVLSRESAEEETACEVGKVSYSSLSEVFADEELRCGRDGMREIRSRPHHSDHSEKGQLGGTRPSLRCRIERSSSETAKEVLVHETKLRDVVRSAGEGISVGEGEERREESVDRSESGGRRSGCEVDGVVEEDVREDLSRGKGSDGQTLHPKRKSWILTCSFSLLPTANPG